MTNKGPLWIREFGADYDVPAAILNRADLQDMSWHNDTAPSFGITRPGARDLDDDTVVRIWCEHPDVTLREFPDAKRFTVAFDAADTAVETDDVTEALEALDRLVATLV